jgi:hypothetical protein
MKLVPPPYNYDLFSPVICRDWVRANARGGRTALDLQNDACFDYVWLRKIEDVLIVCHLTL